MRSQRERVQRTIDDFLAGKGSGDERLDAFFADMAAAPGDHPDHAATLTAVLHEIEAERWKPPETVLPLPARWRRRAVFSTLLSSLVVKIAFAGAALAATTGGLAATGNLPDPAQQVVSDLASRVGISLPSPAGESDTEDVGTLAVHEAAPEAPHLPDQASDVARRVIDAVFSGEYAPGDGAAFGKSVADAASRNGKVRAAQGGPPEGRGRPDDPGRPESPGRSESPETSAQADDQTTVDESTTASDPGTDESANNGEPVTNDDPAEPDEPQGPGPPQDSGPPSSTPPGHSQGGGGNQGNP